MKKVIRLTESDLEKIVRKVIEEQSTGVAFGAEGNGFKMMREPKEQQAPEESQGLWKDQEGNVYKLRGITDSGKWSTFINNWSDGSMAGAMKVLTDSGLRFSGSREMSPNPLFGVDWSKAKINDPVNKNGDRVIRMFRNGLLAVAQTGFTDKRMWKTPEFTASMEKMGTKPSEALVFFPNFWDVLEKIVKLQLPKIS